MMHRNLNVVLAAAAAAMLGSAGARASTVSLDLQFNKSTHTFQLFAGVSSPSKGLAAFDVDILGAGGAGVVTSLEAAPQNLVSISPLVINGFKLFTSNGAVSAGSVMEIRASQDTTAGDAAVLILNLGVSTEVLLATGTYTGNVGTLTAQAHSLTSFSVFPSSYTVGGPTEIPTLVVPSVVNVAVPEPSTCVLASLAVAGLLFANRLGRRRRA